MKFKDYDSVRLLADIPEANLVKGAEGAIVLTYESPPAYEVEFFDDRGETIVVTTVPEEALALANPAAPKPR